MKSKSLAISGLLTALGILIPIIFAPYAIRIEPVASYTIASHVPVMIAMFLSPAIAAFVAIGTALGFLMTTTPVIFARALSHLVFATFGAFYIRNHTDILSKPTKAVIFNLVIGFIHALCEVLVVLIFFNSTQEVMTIILFTGIGGFIHSLIDFTIASVVVKRLPKM